MNYHNLKHQRIIEKKIISYGNIRNQFVRHVDWLYFIKLQGLLPLTLIFILMFGISLTLYNVLCHTLNTKQICVISSCLAHDRIKCRMSYNCRTLGLLELLPIFDDYVQDKNVIKRPLTRISLLPNERQKLI